MLPELWVPRAPKGAPHGAHPGQLTAGFAGLRALPEPAEGARHPARLRQPLSKAGRGLASLPLLRQGLWVPAKVPGARALWE